MDSTLDPKGAQAPEGSTSSQPDHSQDHVAQSGEKVPVSPSGEGTVSYSPNVDNPYGYYDDGYTYGDPGSPQTAGAVTVTETPKPAPPVVAAGGSGSTPPSSPPASDDDEDDDGMLRMSFLDHLEELRKRILLMLGGVGVAFLVSLTFSNQLWLFVSEPATDALRKLGYQNHNLVAITPMEQFNTVWVKLPVLAAVFIASPWILYQVWAFIAPGLYKRERRWAAPFVIFSAGLFILGGLFAYFVAFRFGITFLLGIGRDINVVPLVSMEEYLNLFINVMLGIGLVFEMPVLIFFLTLLRIVTPKFLIANSRYAILGIVILAAIVTPTPDVVNLMLFATPMCLLFYVGIFASYLLVLQRENRRFPWLKVLAAFLVAIIVLAGALYLAVTKYGYLLVPHWPFLTR